MRVHRVRAAEANDRETIEAVVEQGDKGEAKWKSFAANARHGKRRSQADKRRAIKGALRMKPDMSSNAIVDHVGCSHATVEKYRDKLAGDDTCQIDKTKTRQTADGRTMDTSNIGAVGSMSSTSDQDTGAESKPEERGREDRSTASDSSSDRGSDSTTKSMNERQRRNELRVRGEIDRRPFHRRGTSLEG